MMMIDEGIMQLVKIYLSLARKKQIVLAAVGVWKYWKPLLIR